LANNVETGNLWILTGRRGSGKTTLCRRLAAEAQRLKWDVAGVLSPAVFEGTEKIGIKILDLRSNETRKFARKPEGPPESGLNRPSWIFNQVALAWGNMVLAQATPCDLLIVDEMGPLEFEAGQGWTAGLAAVDSRNYRVSVVTLRPELLATARQRWPFAGVVDMASPEGFFEPFESPEEPPV